MLSGRMTPLVVLLAANAVFQGAANRPVVECYSRPGPTWRAPG